MLAVSNSNCLPGKRTNTVHDPSHLPRVWARLVLGTAVAPALTPIVLKAKVVNT